MLNQSILRFHRLLKTKTLTEYGSYYCFPYREATMMVVFFSISFFHRFSNIVLVAACVLPLIEAARKRQISTLYIHWFLLALFAYFLVSETVTGGNLSSLEKRLLFLFVPLAVALNIDKPTKPVRYKIYTSFVMGNAVAMVFCLIRATVNAITLQNGQWHFNARVAPEAGDDFLTSSVMNGNYYFGELFSYFHHPTYTGIYVLFAMYLVVEILKVEASITTRGILIGCYVIFMLSLFLLSSKAAIITYLLITFWQVSCLSISRKLKISAFLIGAVVSVTFILVNPRLRVFVDTLRTTQLINPEARTGYDLRILSWDASLSLIREINWITGVGEAKKNSALVSVYKRKGYIFPAEKMLNSHNQYLDFMIGGGIIGFGLFMIGIIQLVTFAIRKRNSAFGAFLFIFLFNALFENLLSRHDGILLFSLFVSWFLAERKYELPETEQVV